MPHLIMKPVHWNAEGYRKPAGRRATSGYPKEWGFGHEEWNNAADMTFPKHGVRYRAFHTEPAASPGDGEDNDHVVFMYASHDRVQQLVGIAGRAMDLTEFPRRRKEIRDQIPLARHLDDVMELLRAGRLPVKDANALERNWKSEEQYLPRWECPEDYFLWLDDPIDLDPQEVRDTSKLLTMFGSYTTLSVDQAVRVMNAVPVKLRRPAWYRIRDEIGDSSDGLQADIAAIESDRTVDKTTREQLVQARCGQGRFRQAVLECWKQRCAVTGCSVTEALRASHILSWRESDNGQRLDCNNGLALVASIDALFDKALITFEDDGTMLVSSAISTEDRVILSLPMSLKMELSEKQRVYMAGHRAAFARKSGC